MPCETEHRAETSEALLSQMATCTFTCKAACTAWSRGRPKLGSHHCRHPAWQRRIQGANPCADQGRHTARHRDPSSCMMSDAADLKARALAILRTAPFYNSDWESSHYWQERWDAATSHVALWQVRSTLPVCPLSVKGPSDKVWDTQLIVLQPNRHIITLRPNRQIFGPLLTPQVHPDDNVGWSCCDQVPLLLFTSQRVTPQVHPDDRAAWDAFNPAISDLVNYRIKELPFVDNFPDFFTGSWEDTATVEAPDETMIGPSQEWIDMLAVRAAPLWMTVDGLECSSLGRLLIDLCAPLARSMDHSQGAYCRSLHTPCSR